jgi:hypothetical protein
VDELDELVARVRANGPMPLPLDGWDQASIWGWDETANSLFAALWRNADDPARQPAIRIGPNDLTPVITCPVTLAQHIAMAVDRSPWEVISAVDNDCNDRNNNAGLSESGTIVTMTEGYEIWWPPSPGSAREGPA